MRSVSQLLLATTLNPDWTFDLLSPSSGIRIGTRPKIPTTWNRHGKATKMSGSGFEMAKTEIDLTGDNQGKRGKGKKKKEKKGGRGR